MVRNKDSESNGLAGLSSDKSIQRLKQISALRARGIGETIDLPQIVVCGDQSAGKSSVLEAITGIPFPRSEGLCTKFATEVILEHTEVPDCITATIIPHASRTQSKRAELQKFSCSISDFNELPDLIATAGALMGVRDDSTDRNGPSFVQDVLRIKLAGQTGLHLSIVDLPGLISTASEEQSEKDVEVVREMVKSYIGKERTIILAVVQASNDIANQSIIRMSRQFDARGKRTVGVITKPDLINPSAEVRIAKLAKNQDTTKLHHGFFLLKNPNPVEAKKGITLEQRSTNEIAFFQNSPWKEQMLDPDRVGIAKLKYFCQRQLDQHIERALPKVRNEMKSLIKATEEEIARLPRERTTVRDLRSYLLSLATHYNSLATSALSGDYDTGNASFFAYAPSGPGPTRLRALINEGNTTFSECMRVYGRMLKLKDEASGAELEDLLIDTHNLSDTDIGGSSTSNETFGADLPALSASTLAKEQEVVNESQMKAWVKEIYAKSRGRELPGSYNQILLAELFHHQASKWPHIAKSHLQDTVHNIAVFVDKALAYLDVEEHVESNLREVIATELDKCEKLAEDELDKLCLDEAKHPITYNLHYTHNVRKARLAALQKTISKAVGRAYPFHPTSSADGISAVLESQVAVNTVEQDSSEALANVNAYYKIALQRFVDNVAIQVVERHLVDTLPECFSANRVGDYTDEMLERIAGERPDVAEKRRQLRKQVQSLQAGMEDLRN